MLQGLTMPAAAPEPDGAALVEWEELKSSGGLLSVYRAKVPGGWLVYVCNGYHKHAGATFYPDPTHSWSGATLT